MPLTSLLQVDDQEKLPTGQCRPRVPPTPINLRGEAYLELQKIMAEGKASVTSELASRAGQRGAMLGGLLVEGGLVADVER